MKKLILLSSFLMSVTALSQDHFAGLTNSSRVGILTTSINPAELANMSNKFEVNVVGVSFNVANNKIGFSDLTSNKDIEKLLFNGNEPVNLRIDAEVYGLGFAIKHKSWALAITSKINGKLDAVDVDRLQMVADATGQTLESIQNGIQKSGLDKVKLDPFTIIYRFSFLAQLLL
jgi:hypothetical protein